MAGKLLAWDGLGVRPGLFSLQGGSEWLVAQGGPLQALAFFADWALLFLLIFGTAIHFFPARWSEALGQKVVRRLPAPALAVGLASCMLVISQLLAGPRANIYFSF